MSGGGGDDDNVGTSPEFTFPPPAIPAIPVAGVDGKVLFPIHRIYCIGRNYADHVREMGGDPSRQSPVFFCKPADAIVVCGGVDDDDDDDGGVTIPYPLATRNLHHEVELVVGIGKAGAEIQVDDALSHAFGYAVGIDLTRRDLQTSAKQAGQPWDSAKAFDRSAPISHMSSTNAPSPNSDIWLEVDGQRRQQSTLEKMVWSIPEIISHLSHQFHLQPGDLIFTGTPEGVGPLEEGNVVTAGVGDLPSLKFTIQ